MAGRQPKVGHIRDAFLRHTFSARDLVQDVRDVSAIRRLNEPCLHPEQARRVVELAFLGLLSAWDEFLEQSFVRYLAGGTSNNGYQPAYRMGKSASIAHSYHLISGDPAFDPLRSFSKFGDPKWVIGMAKNYFELGAPYAPVLHANLEILQHAHRLRNRVAHNSLKAREDFKLSALQHLGLANDASLPQGYGVGDLLVTKADRLFGQESKDKGRIYFMAYAVRFRQLAKHICPSER